MAKSERGQALVETALVLPVLLLLIMGMVELGRLGNAYLVVTHAARHGVRFGATGGNNSGIVEKAKNASVPLDSSKLTVSIAPESGRSSGDDISVTVSYPVELFTPFVSGFLTNPVVVKSTITMRVE